MPSSHAARQHWFHGEQTDLPDLPTQRPPRGQRLATSPPAGAGSLLAEPEPELSWDELAPPPPGRKTLRRRLPAAGLGLAEAVAAIGTALILLAWAGHVALNPFPRQAQVSALAHLQLQFWVIGGAAVAIAVAALAWPRAGVAVLAERLACAMAAGLATALVAGAVEVGLNGTPWGLGSDHYDARNLATWAQLVGQGKLIPSAVYPPGFVYLLSWLSDATGQNTFYALKDLQILGAALLGPLAYLAWRLVLRPVWALCLGTVAVIPLVDAYKPASSLSLALAVPLFVALIQVVRRAERYRLPALAGLGAAFGVALGVLVLLHPMYLIWPAPGVVVAMLLLTPWRKAWMRAGVLLGCSLGAFALVCGEYLYRFLTEAGTTTENFVYFDALQDPAYFLMWRGGTPGDVGEWPPHGELGGVGLFAIVVVVSIGVALALGYRRSLVVTVGCCFASVWAWRLYDAAKMYHLEQVRLWPRTSLALVYCALLLTGAAVFVAVRAARPTADGRAVVLGCVVAALLVFGLAGSSTADRYLPRPAGQAGYLTYLGQNTPTLDGQCSRWTYSKVTSGIKHCLPRPAAREPTN